MSAAKLDLEINQGATWRWVLQVDANLTGYKARMQIRVPPLESSSAPQVDLTTENDGIVMSHPTAVTTQLAFYISDTQTGALKFQKALYDVEIVAPGGDVTRVVQGAATLSPGVTR